MFSYETQRLTIYLPICKTCELLELVRLLLQHQSSAGERSREDGDQGVGDYFSIEGMEESYNNNLKLPEGCCTARRESPVVCDHGSIGKH